MSLQLLHSEFPHIWGKFYVIFYQCIYVCAGKSLMQGDPADLFALMNEDADLSSTLFGLVSPLLGLGEAKV